MSTESARKAAIAVLAYMQYGCKPEELDESHLYIQDRRKIDELEHIISTACETVAPPVDVEALAERREQRQMDNHEGCFSA